MMKMRFYNWTSKYWKRWTWIMRYYSQKVYGETMEWYLCILNKSADWTSLNRSLAEDYWCLGAVIFCRLMLSSMSLIMFDRSSIRMSFRWRRCSSLLIFAWSIYKGQWTYLHTIEAIEKRTWTNLHCVCYNM